MTLQHSFNSPVAQEETRELPKAEVSSLLWGCSSLTLNPRAHSSLSFDAMQPHLDDETHPETHPVDGEVHREQRQQRVRSLTFIRTPILPSRVYRRTRDAMHSTAYEVDEHTAVFPHRKR